MTLEQEKALRFLAAMMGDGTMGASNPPEGKNKMSLKLRTRYRAWYAGWCKRPLISPVPLW